MNPHRPITQADLDTLDRPIDGRLIDEQLAYEAELERRNRRAPTMRQALRYRPVGEALVWAGIVVFFLALCALFGGL